MSANVTNENIVQLSPEKIKYAPIAQAIDDIRNGKPVVVADDEGRDNEGTLICSAEKATAQIMNTMMHARGMIRVAMLPERAAQLRLTQNNESEDQMQLPYMISIDAGPEYGVTTGLSANDKAITVQRLTAPNVTALDFRRPGHMFPVTAKKGGVFRKVDAAEAAIDLTRLAGHMPMGVLCEILSEDGSMAQRDDLAAFAKKHGLSFVTISQLIEYRLQNERTVTRSIVKEIDTRFGVFTAVGYKDSIDGGEHLALVKGSVEALSTSVPYVRVQHENLINDMFGKSNTDMPQEMEEAMKLIQTQDSGVVVYLRHSGDSKGLLNALKSYRQQKIEAAGFAANSNEMREYGPEAQILSDLGINKFRRLSNDSKKIVALRGYGLEVVETKPLSANSATTFTAPKVQLPSSAPMPTPAPVAETVATPNSAPHIMANMPTVIMEEESMGEFVSPANAPSVTLTEAPKQEAAPQPAPTVEAPQSNFQNDNQDVLPELKAEPRQNKSGTTMKMGGQVMNGQALFEG